MKKIISFMLSVLLMACLLAGCDNSGESSEPPLQSTPAESVSAEDSAAEETIPSDSPESTPLPIESDENAEDAAVKVNVLVGDRSFTAVLYDNASAEALAAMLPMTLDMSELNGNEKYFYFEGSLPSAAGSVGSIKNGDLMLYGSDCLVLFYEDFQTSYSYTRIGYIEEPAGLKEALGSGSVEVAFIRN